MARPKSGLARNYALTLPVTYLERTQVKEDAKRSRLSTNDYVRLKLGLATIQKAPEKGQPYSGDPDNALDVEELARDLFSKAGDVELLTMASARREAKRRLKEAAEA